MDLTEVLARSQGLGFLGPLPVERQLAHAEAFIELLPSEGRILDLGSGGGLPGLVIVERCPHLEVTLLDASERRTAFLRWAVRELGARAEVVLARAGDAAHSPALRGAFDAVVARSFGPPPATAEYGAAFLASGGALIVSEPPEDRSHQWPAEGLASLGLDSGVLHQIRGARLRRFFQIGTAPDDVPRDERRMARSPRF